jgi:hypothetical protein
MKFRPYALTVSLCVLSLVQAAGCATASKTSTADGRAGYDVHCNGAALTWAACTEKAGELWEAHGYDVLERHTWGL